MPRIFFYLILLFALLTGSHGFSQDSSREIPSPEESEKKISGGVSVDFVSKYVWRGIPSSEGPVLQSEGWFSAYGAQVLVWSNLDLGEAPDGRLNEIDLQASYEYEWKHLKVEPIFLFYFFPNQGGTAPTGEGGIKLSYTLGPFHFTTGHAFDIMEFRGAYFGAVGASYQHEFYSYFSLETGAGIGWGNAQFNEAYFALPKAALNVFQWNLALTFTPCRYLYLTPHLKVSSILDGSLRGQVSSPTNVYGGLQIGAEF